MIEFRYKQKPPGKPRGNRNSKNEFLHTDKKNKNKNRRKKMSEQSKLDQFKSLYAKPIEALRSHLESVVCDMTRFDQIIETLASNKAKEVEDYCQTVLQPALIDNFTNFYKIKAEEARDGTLCL